MYLVTIVYPIPAWHVLPAGITIDNATVRSLAHDFSFIILKKLVFKNKAVKLILLLFNCL